MREQIKDKNRLLHIIDAINIILKRTDGMSYEDLAADRVLFGGIVYYTMIIGEAAYKLSKAFVETHPQVNWQDISDMRHHLVHGYYQVDNTIVWAVVQNDLPLLHQQISRLIAETDWEGWEK